MLYYYGTKISPHMTTTPEGYLICHDVPLARLGAMQYRAGELGLSGDPEQVITVNRYAEDVFAPAAIASFEGKDVTAGHPPENLTADTYAAYSKGHVENVRRQEDFLVGDLIIKDSQLACDVQNGAVREVSAGYTAEFVPEGDCLKQTNIRGNHVAVVPRGRAGHDVAIKDAAQEAGKGRKTMSKMTEALLTFFGVAAKEAEGDDLQQLTAHAATVLDAEATPAADEAVYKEQKGVDIGSKVDELLAKLNALEDRLEKLSAAKEAKDEPQEPTAEAAIDKCLEALTSDSAGSSAQVVDAGEAEAPDCGTVSKDSAVAFLRAMRPAVAAIEDEQTRAAVADAVLAAVQADNKPLQQIMDAVQGKAQAAQRAAARNMDTVCAEQQSAYDALNPHKKN